MKSLNASGWPLGRHFFVTIFTQRGLILAEQTEKAMPFTMAMLAAALFNLFNIADDIINWVLAFIGSLDGWFEWLAPKMWSHFLLPLFSFFAVFVLSQYCHNMFNLRFLSPFEFEELGMKLLNQKIKGSYKTRARRFKAFYGVEPVVIAKLWVALFESRWLFFAGVRGPKPIHLLWGLLFLRRYGTEEMMAVLTGVSEKTFRKWAWFYATGIANLDSVFVSLCLSSRCCCHRHRSYTHAFIDRFFGRTASSTMRMNAHWSQSMALTSKSVSLFLLIRNGIPTSLTDLAFVTR